MQHFITLTCMLTDVFPVGLLKTLMVKFMYMTLATKMV